MRRIIGCLSAVSAALAAFLFLFAAAAAAGPVSHGQHTEPQTPAADEGPQVGPLTALPDGAAGAGGEAGASTTADLLLIPDSANDRVLAFDPDTGDFVAELIPPDPTHLSLPKNAILNAAGNAFLVSDQTNDVVQKYSLDGTYDGVFAPAGGANLAILDNILGIALRPNGNLLVTVDSGANQDTVAEFDTGAGYVGNFIAASSGGLDGPFDIFMRPGEDWLVSSINDDTVKRYDLTTGAYITDLAAISNFPQQIALAANGNILVANFGGDLEGIVELTPEGALVDIHTFPGGSGYRGVYELPNLNLLVTSSDGVFEIDRDSDLVDTKLNSVDAHYIERAPVVHVSMVKTVGLTGDCAVTKAITVTAGTQVTYCYDITNTGALSLTRHTLVDSEEGLMLNNFPFTLAPGGHALLTRTAILTITTVNSADWILFNPGPVQVITATSTATVTVLTPDIRLDKTVGLDPGDCATTEAITVTAGTLVTYCYEVTNTGPVTLTRHTVTDSELGVLLSSFPFVLTPGQNAFFTESTVISSTTINTASWTAFNPGPLDVIEATDSATVTAASFNWLPFLSR
jgi:hypothetical protein